MPGEAHRAQGLGKLTARRKKRIKKSWGGGSGGEIERREGGREEEEEECLSYSFLSPLTHLGKGHLQSLATGQTWGLLFGGLGSHGQTKYV